jgi:hypothetical protein
LSVVDTKLVAIRLLVVTAFDELGSVLDLFPGPVDLNHFFGAFPADLTMKPSERTVLRVV